MKQLAAALLLFLLSGVALAQERPSAWDQVWESEQATARLSLEGRAWTRMRVEGREVKAIALVQAAGGRLRFDYQADGRRWSVIDDGERLIRLFPARQSAVVLPRPAFAADPALAEGNYLARVIGEGRVANRATRLIEVAARGRGPVAWRLWVDQETKFPLKRERYNVDGELTSGTEYVEIRFGARVPPAIFAIPMGWHVLDLDGGGRRLSLPELNRAAGFAVVEPRYLPAGYVLQGGYVQQRGRRGLQAAELRYTDGLRVLSVAQHPRDHGRPRAEGGRGGSPGEGRQHRRGRGGRGGGGWGFGRPGSEEMSIVDRGSEKAIRYFGRERVVVVVGDLTVEELVKIARSVD